MRADSVKDLMVAAVLCLLGIGAFVSINLTEASPIAETRSLTHATMPSVYALILAFLSLLYGANAAYRLLRLRAGRPPFEAAEQVTSQEVGKGWIRERWPILFRTALTLVLLVAYVLLLKHVNFFLLTTVFLFTMFYVYGQNNYKKIAVIAVAGGACLSLLFISILKLPI